MRAISLAAVLFVLTGLPGQAQDAARGAQIYAESCATCHGLTARGDGPMTAILAIAPPDLTRLAARNGAVFPTEFVVRRIDGRDQPLSHGGPMPVFGLIFGGESAAIDAEDGSAVLTKQRVLDIVAWLETVQR